MTWTKSANLPPHWLETLEHAVCDCVNWFRNRGHTRSIAIEQAAEALELTPRKTRSIINREPIGMSREQYDAVFERFMAHLDHQTAEHLKAAETAKARRKQWELMGV